MPSLTATFQPLYGRVMLQVSFADQPTVTNARIYRVLADGTETLVRSHTAVDVTGLYIKLSGGLAVVYDTEVPLDVPIYYRMEPLAGSPFEAVPLSTQLSDTFTRVAAASWGTADTGQTYTLTGTAADYSVSGTQGVMSLTAVNTVRAASPTPLTVKEVAFAVDVTVPVLALTQPIVTEVWTRSLNATTHIVYRVSWAPAATVTLTSFVVINGVTVGTTSATVVSPVAHVAGTPWRIVGQVTNFQTFAPVIKMRAFPVGTIDPGWQISYSNAYLPNAGDVALSAFLTTGNTNGLPVAISWDNLIVSVNQLKTEVVASGGDLWLKSPLHPWADRRVVLNVPQEPDCLPELAIFFQSMADEDRGNRTNAAVVNNRKNPIPMSRIRGGITSTLILITRRFVDRNNVITLNASGDPLFFEGPADYGIPDRYMTVADYTIARLSSDHRQQWRTHSIPHVEVDRPAGLADGVLGTRWVDLCNLYGTFDQATAAGLTWTLVLAGYGSTNPIPSSFRLYSDIPIDFATYGAIPAGGRTYEDLLEDR